MEAQLSALLAVDRISGFALLSDAGALQCAFGALADELYPRAAAAADAAAADADEPAGPPLPDAAAAEPGPLSALEQFAAAFRGGAPPSRFELALGPGGARAPLVVVRRGDAALLAVARGRRAGLSLSYLAGGTVAAVTYARRQLADAPAVVAQLSGGAPLDPA
jgi:hypothetical protein